MKHPLSPIAQFCCWGQGEINGDREKHQKKGWGGGVARGGGRRRGGTTSVGPPLPQPAPQMLEKQEEDLLRLGGDCPSPSPPAQPCRGRRGRRAALAGSHQDSPRPDGSGPSPSLPAWLRQGRAGRGRADWGALPPSPLVAMDLNSLYLRRDWVDGLVTPWPWFASSSTLESAFLHNRRPQFRVRGWIQQTIAACAGALMEAQAQEKHPAWLSQSYCIPCIFVSSTCCATDFWAQYR